MKRRVDASTASLEPHVVWNAFVDLIATENYTALSPLQRKAHLVFWYESEVQNGGHGQYFENQGRDRLRETVDALRDLGLACQASVLARAVERFSGADPQADWLDALPEGFVEQLDQAFSACSPDVTTALAAHLEAHKAEYIEVE